VRHPSLPPLVRLLAETGPPVPDADLLGRFAAGGDPDAFAALVRRHGRLVWAVCHHLAGPDADDAFQATFLVLLRNAGKVRDPNRLSAWLYRVAYRVSSKARRAARRRADRERVAAVPDRDGGVPDSAWDRALAVVHEEVVRLPEVLRVPFVLCVLEGKSVTEAARLLGWRVNTLSVRLARAKDALLDRLGARGFAAGAVVALAAAGGSAPAGAAATAAALARGGRVPESIHVLAQGVLGMSGFQLKLVAVGVLVAVGLGVGGSGWLTRAEAQTSAPPANVSPEEKVRRLEALLDQARREVELQKERERTWVEYVLPAKAAAYSTAKWHYHFVPVTDLEAEGFVKVLQEGEARGWEYNGQTTLKKDGKDAPVWVFRRPKGGDSGADGATNQFWMNLFSEPSGNRKH
jgi:RNA polymerase sigma factor (sigma-70 family)